MSKSIAIIGAGNSGILAYNSCLEQGLKATVFEITDQICGQWLYREDVMEGITSLYKSLTLNTSKEMSAFSTFPPPKEFPNYMPHSKMAEYINSYADKIGFKDSVKLRHEVINCEPNEDYEETGKWKLTVKDLDYDQVESLIFDGVMVCTGQVQKKQVPHFKGQEIFRGTVTHSREYKDEKGFENKNVVVVGCGVSGADITAELSRFNDKVYLVSRSGVWFTSRVGPWGLPTDYALIRRAIFTFPHFLLNYLVEKYNSFRADPKFFALMPKHRYIEQAPFFTEELQLKMMTGQVVIKRDIDCFTENGLIFKGETEETQCGAVILATGYRKSFPFLEELFKKHNFDINENLLDLYEYQFLPFLRHARTLSFIGISAPFGPTLTVAELQSRWYSLIMADKLSFPGRDEMIKLTNRKKEWTKTYYPLIERKLVQGQWIPMMDNLANKIGCKPNLLYYFFTDPKFWWELYFGPCLPYQFRLEGPNSWPGARDAILTVSKRTSYPLRIKDQSKSRSRESRMNVKLIILIILTVLLTWLF